MNKCYILSCAVQDGLRTLSKSKEGQLTCTSVYDIDKPMYGALRGDILYAILRCPDGEGKASAVAALKRGVDGSFTPLGEPVSCKGIVACHLSISPDGRYLYTANYSSGSISELSVADDGSLALLRQVITHQAENGSHPQQTDWCHD